MVNIYIESRDKHEEEGKEGKGIAEVVNENSFWQQKILVLGGFLFKVARKSRTPESTFFIIMHYLNLKFKRILFRFIGGPDETCTRSSRVLIPESFCKLAHDRIKIPNAYKRCIKFKVELV